MSLGRSHRGEHAQLAKTALRHHDEAGRGDKGYEHHGEGCYAEHADGGEDAFASRATRRGDPVRPAWSAECHHPRVAGFDQDCHRIQADICRRSDQREVRAEVAWILDDADQLSLYTVEGESLTDVDPEGRRQIAGEGDFVVRGGEAPLSDIEHGAAEGTVRILGPQLDGFEQPGDPHIAAADDIDGAEPPPRGSDLGFELGISGVELEPVVGRAVVGRPDAGAALYATAAPKMAAATETVISPRIRSCWRHSRRNSRHAQRTTARRAAMPPEPRAELARPILADLIGSHRV